MNDFDIDNLFNTIKDDKKSEEEKEMIKEQALHSLKGEQKIMLEKALNDSEYLKSLLNSPKAQEILGKLKNK